MRILRRFCPRFALVVVLTAGLPLAALASDHADPPALAADPAVDIADIYAFVGGFTDFGGEVGLVPNAVIIMTLVGAPELDVRYRMLFDTDPSDDGETGFTVDSQLDLWFTPNPTGDDGTPWCLNFELGALGVNSCLNPAWYDAETGSYNINVPLVEILGAGAVQIFGGWRDDPFFFDEGAFRAAVAGLAVWSATFCDVGGDCECPGGPTDTSCFLDLTTWTGAAWGVTDISEVLGVSERGDTYAGSNVYAFVIEAPSVALGATFISAYAASYRRASLIRTPQGDIERGPWVQVDRTAVPGLSAGLLGDDELRLLYNRDSVDTSYSAVLATAIGGIRLLASRALLAFNHPDRTPPTPSPTIEELLALVSPDLVHLDLTAEAVPPFPTFPNGRTLSYDVMDAVLSLVLGLPVTDAVQTNDVAFDTDFPYLAAPHSAE